MEIDHNSSSKKMSDICDYLHSTELLNEESLSNNFVDYLRTNRLENQGKSSWETDDYYLKYGNVISISITLQRILRFKTIISKWLLHSNITLQSSCCIRENFTFMGTKSLGKLSENHQWFMSNEIFIDSSSSIDEPIVILRSSCSIYRTFEWMQWLSSLSGIFKRKSFAIILHSHRF